MVPEPHTTSRPPRLHGAIVAALAIAALASTSAPPVADATPARETAARRDAAKAWTACFAAGAAVPDLTDILPEPEEMTWLEVKRRRGGFRIEASWGGSGYEAVYGGLAIDFEPRGCGATWALFGSHDGALARRVRVGWINRPAPDDRLLEALVARPARPDDVANAFGRVWMLHNCGDDAPETMHVDAIVQGPIAAAQPWHPGPPRRSAASFWTLAQLDALGPHEPHDPEAYDDVMTTWPGGPEIAGIYSAGNVRPVRTYTAAGVAIYEAELPGRNGGRAIAIRDLKTNRHRWVVATRGCVNGTTVEWLGAVDRRIVGVTSSRHGMYAREDAVLILDVPTGTAWTVPLPDVIQAARDEVRRGHPVRGKLVGTTVTLRLGPTRATVDLAPMLAAIPAP